MDDLETHRGVPSDAMGKLSPFDQYRRVMAGKDRLWCGNIATIFTQASNALHIPARRHRHGNRVGPPAPPGKEGPVLLLAEGHGTTEIFSDRLDGWVWIDLTFGILAAYLGEEGPLTMAELYVCLNEPALGKAVAVGHLRTRRAAAPGKRPLWKAIRRIPCLTISSRIRSSTTAAGRRNDKSVEGLRFVPGDTRELVLGARNRVAQSWECRDRLEPPPEGWRRSFHLPES